MGTSCKYANPLRNWLGIMLLLASSAGAQPAWVKEAINRGAEVKPHKDAKILVLCATSEVTISQNGRVNRANCWAGRVLTRAGVDAVTLNEKVTGTRKVKDLKGWLIRPDGKKVVLEKDRIVEIDLDQAAGYYNDDRSLIASFSDVKPGDVVAYEYTVEENDPWTGYNLEYRPEEPFMPSWSLLSRRAAVTCYDPESSGLQGHRDWRSVAAWMRSLQDRACADTAALAGTVSTVCGNLTQPGARLRAIAHYVRDNIRYVAVEIGAGRFQPRAAGTTLTNRYGDCKDKVALVRAMLALAGIPSEAVGALIGERVDPDFPSPFQFNHVIIAIPIQALPDLPPYPDATVDGWLYFDPTDEATDLGQLPSGLRGTYVLKTSVDDGATTRLPSPEPEDQRRVYRAAAELKPDYSLRAKVTVVDYGVWGAASRYEDRTSATKDLVEAWQKRFAGVMQNPTLSDFTTGADGDSAWVSFDLSGERIASVAGQYHLLTTDFFHSDNADDLTAAERVHPISFGNPTETMTKIDWHLPPGWGTDGKPEVIQDSCVLARVDCRVTGDTSLTLESRIVYYGGTVGPEQYDQAKRFNKNMRASQRVRTFLRRSGS
ncbi:MAG: DUF3857 and transglutaminase domain-containing protein [candidate division Zixibacteria bacterium]|nr:DUF3857 and transglutaminase domain-containing protein [candidate division Zixibacteria bacterium]